MADPSAVRQPETPKRAAAEVHALPFTGDDGELVEAVRKGHPGARRTLFDRHSRRVEKLLLRVLGPDDEITDLLQEVFLAAIDRIDELSEPAALRGWLSSIAVFQARGLIRRRTRRRWLQLTSTGELPEREATLASPEVSEALRATYSVLGKLPSDERIAFALRFIDGMELTEVADACGVSLATIKRRLSKARSRFFKLAEHDVALSEWVERGGR